MTTKPSNEGGFMQLQRADTSCAPKSSPFLEELMEPTEEALEGDLTPSEMAELLDSVDTVDDVDPSKIEIPYNGYKRSVTGIIKMLRSNGDHGEAELLESLTELGEASKKFFQAKRRATSNHKAYHRKTK